MSDLKPVTLITGASAGIGAALSWWAKPGSVSSSDDGSATQHCSPWIGSPSLRCSGAVRSECTMPRPAVIQLTSPGRIAMSLPRLSRCTISPS